MTSVAVAEAAPAALDPLADLAVEVHLVVVAHAEVVHSMAVAHVEAVHSLTVEVPSLTVEVHMVEVHMVEAVLTDMEAWVAVAKFRAPACAPLHSSCVVPRS